METLNKQIDVSEFNSSLIIAVRCVDGYLIEQERKGEYTITAFERLLFREKSIWRFTFKAKHLLEAAGGEIFANVNLDESNCEIRLGE